MKILITSGGTKVPIDRVRSITNMSQGTFGSRIADAFFDEGLKAFLTGNEYGNPIEKITFFTAKNGKFPTAQFLNDETYEDEYRPLDIISYSTFDDYKSGIEELLKKETYDIIVVAAAVSDYGVANYYDGKYRSREDDMCIKLVKLPKILPIMRKIAPDSVICGFKLLVDSTTAELLNAMKNQIVESDVDLVIGNDLRDIKNDDHKLTVMSKHNTTPREYSLPPSEDRKHFVVYPLAKAVVDECIKAYERKLHVKQKTMTDIKDKKVFIAGPMRGYEKYNFPKFDKIEKILKDNGIECVNPGRISRKFKEKDVNGDINVYNEMVRLQQEAEHTCNAILLLDGWQHSKGVALEVKTAAELGMQFLLESDLPREWFT